MFVRLLIAARARAAYPLVALAVGCLSLSTSASPAIAGVRRVATLRAPVGLTMIGVAAANGTVAVATEQAAPEGGSGPVEVFTRAPGGWAHAQADALLADAAATVQGSRPSVSGNVVLAGAQDATGVRYDDVFVNPAGGWRGTLAPAARLTGPGGAGIGHGVIVGRIVVAAADPVSQTDGAAFVFVEPAGGWTGTLTPSAVLRDSPVLYSPVPPLGITGSTILTGSQGPPVHGGSNLGEAFTVPAAGWTGVVHPSSTLPYFYGGVHPSGQLIGSFARIFALDRRDREVTQAYLYARNAIAAPAIAAFDDELVLSTGPAYDVGNVCSCRRQVFLFSKPRRGWHQMISAPASLQIVSPSNDPGAALLGSTAFLVDRGAVDVEASGGEQGEPVALPQIARLTAHSTKSRLQISLAIVEDKDAAPLTGVSVLLPRGLFLNTNRGALTRGVSIHGSHSHGLEASARRLTIFSTQATRLTISIRYPALRGHLIRSARLAAQISQGVVGAITNRNKPLRSN